jgi:hypothetical protein
VPQSKEQLTIVSPAKHEDFRPLFCDKYDTANFRLPIAEISVNGAFNIVCNSIPDLTILVQLDCGLNLLVFAERHVRCLTGIWARKHP